MRTNEPDREHTNASPTSRPAAPVPVPSTAALLALQRTAGNTAVTALVQAANSRRALARFEGPEHAELGDVTGDTVDLGNGVVLTWGQVVAIAGDEYENLDDLRNDATTPTGRAHIRLLLEHAQVPGSVAATLPPPTDAQRDAYMRTYLQIMLGNVTHFAGGGTAIETWRGHHDVALANALAAGLAGDPNGMQVAFAEEAFGEHFLTDSFAAGHVRTPRADITAHHVEEFAPRVADHFVASIRARVEAGVVAQIDEQSVMPDVAIRRKVHTEVGVMLTQGIQGLGGQAELERMFGEALSGVIAGALHDTDGTQGVAVASEAHPEPWRALGDGKLSLDPITREQAELAIMAAREDLSVAYDIGDKERNARQALPELPPAIVYFPFDSSELGAAAAADVAVAQSYLRHHTDVQVELVGHTDPLGDDDYNFALGMKRAEAVAAAILADGVDPAQVLPVRSAGKQQLASTDAHTYNLNRRTELLWASRADGAGGVPGGIDLALAQRALAAAAGPPYTQVERFLPHALDAVASPASSTENAPLPDFRWETLPPELQQQVVESDPRARRAGGRRDREPPDFRRPAGERLHHPAAGAGPAGHRRAARRSGRVPHDPGWSRW